jgi:hypothetical protein
LKKEGKVMCQGNKIVRFVGILICAVFLSGLVVSSTEAVQLQLGGKPLSVQGYINQTVSYGTVSNNEIDTKKGFNSFVTQALVEALYQPDPSIALFGSLKLNADWAYGLDAGNGEWKDKQFDKARDRLFILDKPRDFIQELHATWEKDGFYVRGGKQVVAWGQTDGFRLMDQINPVDARRGVADVEFENTIMPIWLLRTEYRTAIQSTWLQDLTYQFVFNPNADSKEKLFNQIWPGNAVSGIWSPYSRVSLGGTYPSDYGYLSSFDEDISSPKTFDPQGFAYAFRMSGTVGDTRITLNGYYGRDHNPAVRITGNPRLETSAYDGRQLVHLPTETYFPLFRFVGGTATKDLTWLSSAALGGVAPVLRMEALYAFDSTFTNDLQEFVKHDEMRAAVGMDWKVRIDFLNPRTYFFISPQIYNRRIMNYPHVENGLSDWNDTVKENTWTTTLLVNTSYLHNKLQPSFFWMRDWTMRGSMYIAKLAWEPDTTWKYTLGWIGLAGEKDGHSLQRLSHKDQAFFTVSYRF